MMSVEKMGLRESMRAHIEARYPILYVVTFDERSVDDLISELAESQGILKRNVLEWNMACGFVDFDKKTPVLREEYKDLPAALDYWLVDHELDNHFLIVKDAHLALRDSPLAVARLRALTRKIKHNDVVATVFLVSSQPFVPQELEQFITIFDQPAPEESEIGQLIQDYVARSGLIVDEDVANQLVLAFRGLSAYEIDCLLNRAYQRDGDIGISDIELVIEEKKQIVKKSGILEMVSVTGKEWDELGGLEALKTWLGQKKTIMSDLPRAWKFGVETPKGVMVVGMPGCGKSMTAKATSVLLKLPLLRLDIGSLMGRYVGDSEANMRRALRLAETVSPCVLWVDELEKAFAGIGDGASPSSEVTTRLFGYFLTWMQEKTKPIFVVTTANDISALPPELLRKGRFDEMFYVDFPTEDERVAILKVHLEKRGKNGPGLDVDNLAHETERFSGADLEGIVKDAIERAFLEGEGETKLADDHLRESMKKNRSHAKMMKDKAEKFRKMFKEYGIRSASE